MLKSSGTPSNARSDGIQRGGRYRHYWLRLVGSVRARPRDTAPGSTPHGQDADVFALQCAEWQARVEFDTAMELWANRS